MIQLISINLLHECFFFCVTNFVTGVRQAIPNEEIQKIEFYKDPSSKICSTYDT